VSTPSLASLPCDSFVAALGNSNCVEDGTAESEVSANSFRRSKRHGISRTPSYDSGSSIFQADDECEDDGAGNPDEADGESHKPHILPSVANILCIRFAV
jgi:hypothetical protein